MQMSKFSISENAKIKEKTKVRRISQRT